MCLACEESDMYYRWQLLQQIAKGEMPEGHSEEDLRALGLPLPNEIEIVDPRHKLPAAPGSSTQPKPHQPQQRIEDAAAGRTHGHSRTH